MGAIAFRARVETVALGRATHRMIRLPDEIQTALADAERVDVEINGQRFNRAIRPVPRGEGVCLWIGKPLLDTIKAGPGDWVDLSLSPADPDAVDLPGDLEEALTQAQKAAGWEALSTGKRRGLLYHLQSAKRPETRARRIRKLIAEL